MGDKKDHTNGGYKDHTFGGYGKNYICLYSEYEQFRTHTKEINKHSTTLQRNDQSRVGQEG